jgi:hypothetical protein
MNDDIKLSIHGSDFYAVKTLGQAGNNGVCNYVVELSVIIVEIMLQPLAHVLQAKSEDDGLIRARVATPCMS